MLFKINEEKTKGENVSPFVFGKLKFVFFFEEDILKRESYFWDEEFSVLFFKEINTITQITKNGKYIFNQL